ncbi:MAG: hypothetical protein AB1689_01680 [Thermodesulfobacteriota bacterium]
MDGGTLIMAGAIAAAVVVPVVVNAFLKRNPRRDEESNRKRRELLGEAETLLAEVVDSVRRGQPLEVGPGSAFHERFTKLREAVRYDFSSAARANFDTSVGFELGRPGRITMPLDVLVRRVNEALAALREQVED